MPVRTNRGRAAVYRKLWSWPLRSPGHFVGAVVLLVALGTGIGILLSHARPDDGQQGQQAPVSYAPSVTFDEPSINPDTLPNRVQTPVLAPTSAAPNAQGLAVAQNWAKAWVDHPKGTSQQKWLDGLKPYTTEEYLPTMRSIELGNVPGNKVTGRAKATQSLTSSMVVEVPTNGGKLSISVISTPSQGWRVSGYTKA